MRAILPCITRPILTVLIQSILLTDILPSITSPPFLIILANLLIMALL